MGYADSRLINRKAARLFFAQFGVLQVLGSRRIVKQVHELFQSQMQPITDLGR